MIRFIIVRLLGVPPALLLISFGVFALLHSAPGDPAVYLLPDEASEVDLQRARERWGLDQPIYVQYCRFLISVLQGDFGESFRYRTPVLRMILDRLPATLELALFAIVVAIVAGVACGIYAGLRPNSLRDNLTSTVSFIGMSMPSFWLGIMLILLFAGYFRILPSSGRAPLTVDPRDLDSFVVLGSLARLRFGDAWTGLRHLLLPAITLALPLIAINMRVTRSSIIEVLNEGYIRTARAKGIGERAVIWRHALKNALLLVITVVGLELGALLSGSLIVETVFSWPGVGTLLVYGIGVRDYPLITGVVIVYTTMFLVINVAVDILYGVLDPRIRV